jgi:hypothetical protein
VYRSVSYSAKMLILLTYKTTFSCLARENPSSVLGLLCAVTSVFLKDLGK